MKILALDIGDQWTGIAISDPLGILARPLTTIKSSELEEYIKQITSQENINTILIGNPITLKGKLSEQTKKVHATAEELKKKFPDATFILWDERLTSKMASKLSPAKEKQKIHARAAAFILESYLQNLSQKKSI